MKQGERLGDIWDAVITEGLAGDSVIEQRWEVCVRSEKGAVRAEGTARQGPEVGADLLCLRNSEGKMSWSKAKRGTAEENEIGLSTSAGLQGLKPGNPQGTAFG